MGFIGLNGDLMGLSGALYGFNGYPPVNVSINDHNCGKPTICGSFLRKTMAFPHLYFSWDVTTWNRRFFQTVSRWFIQHLGNLRCLIFCSSRGNKSRTGE